MEDHALRLLIRTKLEDGGLPRGLHGKVAEVSVADTGIGIIVRRGTGRLCDVCGKAIEKHSIERVVQGPRGTSALTHEN